MLHFPRSAAVRTCLQIGCAVAAWSVSLPAQTAVRSLKLLDSKDAVEVEVEASDRVTPEIQALTNPERLVVDFPNALPGPQLRNLPVHRGQVKGIRVGLFQARPPVTRIVLDLSAAQSYRVFPYGRTVIIKVESSSGVAPAVAASNPAVLPAQSLPTPTSPPQPALQVSYENGLLAIHSDKASLSDVLQAVHQRTGAEVGLAPGTEQEKVVIDLGPAPAPEVIGHLLNGCKFNFLIVSAPSDPNQLDRIILTPRADAGPEPLAPMNPSPVDTAAKSDDTDEQPAPARPEAVPPPPDPAPAHPNPDPPPQ